PFEVQRARVRRPGLQAAGGDDRGLDRGARRQADPTEEDSTAVGAGNSLIASSVADDSGEGLRELQLCRTDAAARHLVPGEAGAVDVERPDVARLWRAGQRERL